MKNGKLKLENLFEVRSVFKLIMLSLVIVALGAFELYATWRYYQKMQVKGQNMLSAGRLWAGIISGGALFLIGLSAFVSAFFK